MLVIPKRCLFMLYTKLYLHTITGTKLFRVKRKSSSDSEGKEEAGIWKKARAKCMVVMNHSRYQSLEGNWKESKWNSTFNKAERDGRKNIKEMQPAILFRGKFGFRNDLKTRLHLIHNDISFDVRVVLQYFIFLRETRRALCTSI